MCAMIGRLMRGRTAINDAFHVIRWCVSVFGSQPPMHLTAPSPIHPATGLPTAPLSPNTLQVNQVNHTGS